MSAGSVGTNPIQAAIQALQWAIPYKKGGTTTSGMDAAGLVQWVFSQAGVQLPGLASQQYSTGNNVPVGPPGNQLAYVQPGDVVFQGTGNPGTESEGIVYSTAGQGTVITSTPSKGVTYQPLTGSIDAIRRYSGDPTSGQAGDPYSSTMAIYQVVKSGYIPTNTLPSGTPNQTPVTVDHTRLYELLLIVGGVATLVIAKGRIKWRP